MSVPKTAMYKNRLSAANKHNIGLAWQIGTMQAKPIAHGKKKATN